MRKKYIRKYTGRSEFAAYTEPCWCFMEAQTPEEAILNVLLREATPNKSKMVYNFLYDFCVGDPLEI